MLPFIGDNQNRKTVAVAEAVYPTLHFCLQQMNECTKFYDLAHNFCNKIFRVSDLQGVKFPIFLFIFLVIVTISQPVINWIKQQMSTLVRQVALQSWVAQHNSSSFAYSLLLIFLP